MTERFYVAESNLIDGYCVFDREKKYAFYPRPRKADCLNDAHTLNELHEENNELKCESKMVYERNAYKKLYDECKQENEQLKSKVDYLERKIARERVSSMKQQEKWEKEAKETIEKLQHRIQTYKSANALLKKTLEDHKCQNTN